MKKVIVPIVLAILLWMPGCSGNGGDTGSDSNSNAFRAPGVVDGDIITLKAQAAGIVRQFDIEEGRQVNKGDLLVRIDSDKVENQVRELDITLKEIELNGLKISRKLRFLVSNIAYLRKQVERFRRLNKTSAIPGEKLEAMELKLMEAETSRFDLIKTREGLDIQKEKIGNKREYLQLLLKDHEIRSPGGGVVLETFVTEGETVFPGAAVADILDISSLYVEVFIEEQELGRLKLNREVTLLVDGMEQEGAEPLTGVIALFGKKAEFSPKYILSEKERKSLLYRVKIKVPGSEGVLKIGMPVTVVFQGG